MIGQKSRTIHASAQAFYAAFGVGEDERHISTVDAAGVALAAIQRLHGILQQQQAAIRKLEAAWLLSSLSGFQEKKSGGDPVSVR